MSLTSARQISTAETMRDLCHGVVTHGTGVRANIPEFRVGGKTGTAQIAKSDGSGYYDDRYTAVFAGFAPVADPRLCAVIVVDCPEMKKHYGGYAAAPVFRNVVEAALIEMNCPQDRVRVAVETPPPLEGDADTVIARAELDLIRQYFVAYSRPQFALVIMGSTDQIRRQSNIPCGPTRNWLTRRSINI